MQQQALQPPTQRQPTAQQTLGPPPAQVPAAAARKAAAVICPTEVAHALWLLATHRQQLAGRSVVVRLQTFTAANGEVVESLHLTREQVSILLPDVPPRQLPATFLTTKGTPCSGDHPGSRYISGFAEFRKAAGVQKGARVKVQAINGRLPWLLVTSVPPVPSSPPAQQPPAHPAAAAAAPPAIAASTATAVPPSSPLSPRYSLRQGSESGNLTQLNAAAGKCWLRRQLRVRLGSGNSSATGGSSPANAAADASAATMPLLSVPAADVRDLLHPYARCSRYTLVSDSGVEQEMAFGGGGSEGGGDMCSSSDGELASFLQAAGISPGSNVSIAVATTCSTCTSRSCTSHPVNRLPAQLLQLQWAQLHTQVQRRDDAFYRSDYLAVLVRTSQAVPAACRPLS
jgi:hypothetical protein